MNNLRFLDMTNLFGPGASGGELTALWQVEHIRDYALYGLQPVFIPLKVGDRAYEPLGVGMGASVYNVPGGAGLDHLAAVHDVYPVRHLGHNRQVVGDQYKGSPLAPDQLRHKPQYLGLDSHVQGGCGLVGYYKLRVRRQGYGYDHPLSHAAAELVGIGLQPALGVGYSHRPQQLYGSRFSLLWGQICME